jgi:hypothetical protein
MDIPYVKIVIAAAKVEHPLGGITGAYYIRGLLKLGARVAALVM